MESNTDKSIYSHVFAVYVYSMDGAVKHLKKYIRLNSHEAISTLGQSFYITERGWRAIGVIDPAERQHFEVKIFPLQDRLNRISELNYRIQELTQERETIALTPQEVQSLGAEVQYTD